MTPRRVSGPHRGAASAVGDEVGSHCIRLEAVSLQMFPLVDAASPLTSQFKRKGEVHHCPLGWMSLTCLPDLSNVAFLIRSALALGIPSTIEQFLRRGGYGSLEVQLASLDHALCHASDSDGGGGGLHADPQQGGGDYLPRVWMCWVQAGL